MRPSAARNTPTPASPDLEPAWGVRVPGSVARKRRPALWNGGSGRGVGSLTFATHPDGIALRSDSYSVAVMRALYRAEDYLEEAARSVAKPVLRRALSGLGRFAGTVGDVLRSLIP
jgi:hypothetical protein